MSRSEELRRTLFGFGTGSHPSASRLNTPCLFPESSVFTSMSLESIQFPPALGVDLKMGFVLGSETTFLASMRRK